MILRLASGSSTPASRSRKRIGCVHVDEVGVELVLEHVDDLLGFALAHEAVVHVHADELTPDGLDQQCGDNGAVHAARKSQQRFLVADLLAACRHLLLDERLRQLGRGDALHVVRTLVGIHRTAP